MDLTILLWVAAVAAVELACVVIANRFKLL